MEKEKNLIEKETNNVSNENAVAEIESEPGFFVNRFLRMENSFFVEVEFHLPAFGIYHETKQIPLEDVDQNNRLRSYVPICFIIGNSTKETLNFLRERINLALKYAEPKQLLSQGYTLIESTNQWKYVLGDMILPNDDSEGITLYAYNPKSVKIALQKASPSNMYRWVRKYCDQGEDKTVMLLASLTPLLYPLFQNLEIPMSPVSVLFVAPSGAGKTSFASLLTSWGETLQAKGVNLSSDSSFLFKEIGMHKDRTLLIDDCNLTSVENEKNKKLGRLSELIQLLCGAGGINIKGQEVNMERISMIITSELELAHFSAANRVILIRGAISFNPQELTWLQNLRWLFDNFIISFVSFICMNADELLLMIRRCMEQGEFDYKGAQLKADEYVGYMRVMTSNRVLCMIKQVLIQYLVEMNVFETNDREKMEFADLLEKSIQRAVSGTLETIRKPSQISDVLMAFLNIFKKDIDEIYTEGEEMFEEKKKLLFRHKDVIYFQSESLASYLSSIIGRNVSIQALNQELLKAKLLLPYCGGYGTRIPAKLDPPKNVKNARFHTINIYALMDLVRSVYPGIFDLIESPIRELRPKAYR